MSLLRSLPVAGMVLLVTLVLGAGGCADSEPRSVHAARRAARDGDLERAVGFYQEYLRGLFNGCYSCAQPEQAAYVGGLLRLLG